MKPSNKNKKKSLSKKSCRFRDFCDVINFNNWLHTKKVGKLVISYKLLNMPQVLMKLNWWFRYCHSKIFHFALW